MGDKSSKGTRRTPEEICFKELKGLLEDLEGQSVSLTILECCEELQGIISKVNKGTIILEGDFGTRVIPICQISSLNPCRVLAYVVNLGPRENPGNTVSVIDTSLDKLIKTIIVGNGAASAAINPDGTRVYVTNIADDTVSVIRTATNKVIDTIPVGDGPLAVEFTPDGRYAYVTNSNENTVSAINTKNNTVFATIEVGIEPFGLAIGNTPLGPRAYVVNSGETTVSIIDVDPDSPTYVTVISKEEVGSVPIDAAITPQGTTVYVTNSGDNTVSAIDTATNVVTTIHVGLEPAGVGIGVTPLGTRAYILNSGGDTISVIDAEPNSPTFNTVIFTITKGVGDSPSDAEFTPDGRKVYVPNNNSNNVSVIDSLTNTIIDTIPVGINPNTVAIGRVCSIC